MVGQSSMPRLGQPPPDDMDALAWNTGSVYDHSVATVVRVNANVPWKCLRAKGGNWVAVCDPLKLTVQAESYAELMEDIGLTLNGLLADLLASNELNRFLRDHGWVLMGTIPSRREDVRFDVPFFPAMVADGSSRDFHQ